MPCFLLTSVSKWSRKTEQPWVGQPQVQLWDHHISSASSFVAFPVLSASER